MSIFLSLLMDNSENSSLIDYHNIHRLKSKRYDFLLTIYQKRHTIFQLCQRGDFIVFPEKRKKLEAKGWKVGSADEFLQLTPEEVEYIELKLTLRKYVKKHQSLRMG